MSGLPSLDGASGVRPAGDGAASVSGRSVVRDLWASAGWALSAVAWGIGLYGGLMLLVAVVVGVAGGGRAAFNLGLGATVYLLPFVVVIALVIVLPVTLVLLSVWVLLARRGRIDDGSRAGLGVSAAVTAVIGALVFGWTSRSFDEPFSWGIVLTLALLALLVCASLLLPRYTVLGLEPGRFRPSI